MESSEGELDHLWLHALALAALRATGCRLLR